MPATVTKATERDCFAVNLDALRKVTPAWADRLSEVQVGDRARRAVGRDGSESFQIQDTDGRWRWLGRTSMPRVRADALVETFAPDGRNVLLPAIGAGAELVRLLSRAPEFTAVFVLIGPDLIDARLAFSVHDLSRLIGQGRFVLIDGSDIEASLVAFFSEHGGYEFPSKMLVTPELDDDRVATIRVAVERASAVVCRLQSERVGALSRSLVVRSRKRTRVRKVCVISIDPRPSVVISAGALREAAGDRGIEMDVCVPDLPGKCHALARMNVVADSETAATLLLNCGWGPLSPQVPETVNVAAWLLPDARILPGQTDGFDAPFPVFVATPNQAETARRAGISDDRILELPIGARERDYHPIPCGVSDRFDVACIGDLSDLSATACGFTLASHVRLWECVRHEIVRFPERAVEEALAAAERVAHVPISDAEVRGRFLSVLRERAMRAQLRVSVVRSLQDGGVDVRVFGRGWNDRLVPRDRIESPANSPDELNRIYNRSKVVVFPWHCDETIQNCLDVWLAGACPVCLKLPGAPPPPPSLTEVFELVPTFEDIESLRQGVRTLFRDPDGRDAKCEKARSIIMDRHLMKHRWATILQTLANQFSPS